MVGRPPLPAAIALSFLFLTGCVRPGGRNSDCQWPAEPGARPLRVNQSEDRRHLRADMGFGEELAIEHMDAHHGPRSGAFKSHEAATQAMRACLIQLAGQIGQTHTIDPKELGKFFGVRDPATDAALILSFLALYYLSGAMLGGWLLCKYPP